MLAGVTYICDHTFQLNADGEVRCTKCFVLDDEMVIDRGEDTVETQAPKTPDFWETQVSFEE